MKDIYTFMNIFIHTHSTTLAQFKLQAVMH